MRKPCIDSLILTPLAPVTPVIAALQNDVFRDEPWPASDIANLVQGPGALALLAAGRAYGEVMPVGYLLARIAADEAEILSLGVLADARRQGLGARLLAEFLAKARTRGAGRAYLEVAADNGAAIALYRGAGFEEVGRRAGYYTHRGPAPVDALVLSRDLSFA
jgi:ribosomal-protein-alanine N-acetyltransferase